MLQTRPYFMKNKDWYVEIPTSRFTVKWELTELGKSIPEVKKSYEEYMEAEKHYTPDPYFSYRIMQDAEKSLREDYKKQGLTDQEIEKKIKKWRDGE